MIVTKAYASITNSVVPGGNNSTAGATTLASLIAILWKTAIIVGGLAFLVFFIMGTLEWIMSGGDKGKKEDAKNKLTQGFTGLAILAGSLVIAKFAGQAIGIDLLNIIWPTPPSQQQQQQNTGSTAPTTRTPSSRTPTNNRNLVPLNSQPTTPTTRTPNSRNSNNTTP